MRCFQVEKEFGLSNLQLRNRKQKPLKAKQVRVKVKAASLNYRDLLVIKGQYNKKQALPLVPLSDGAGEIIEVGPEVKHLKPKDRVAATFSQSWTAGLSDNETIRNTLGSPLDGMLTEEITLSEQGVIKFPEYLSYEEASTLPCAALTAFNAVTNQCRLLPGDIIVLEGCGGVSIFSLLFAKVMGLRVIILSSSNEKLEYAKRLGADFLINYKEKPEWHHEVFSITKKRGADLVIDVGGAKTINKAIASLKRGGTVCVIGILSGVKNEIDLRPILMREIRLKGVFVGSKSLFTSMNRVLEFSKLHPIIDRVFPFEKAKDALSYLESHQHFGKVVIRM